MFADIDSRGLFVETLVLNAADQGLGQKIFENPLTDLEHNLRHYTGALTDIRPAKTEFYF